MHNKHVHEAHYYTAWTTWNSSRDKSLTHHSYTPG